MASARALARTQPVASVTHWLPCEAVHSASDLSRRSHLLLLKLRGPMGDIVSPRSKTLGSHNPRAKDGLGAVCVRTCHLFTRQGWYMGGPGLERVWNGVWNETAHSSTALPPRSAPLSKFAVWSENSAASNS